MVRFNFIFSAVIGFVTALMLTTCASPSRVVFCEFEVELYGGATIPKNGKIKVPTGPGLGLEPVPEALEKFRLSV